MREFRGREVVQDLVPWGSGALYAPAIGGTRKWGQGNKGIRERGEKGNKKN